MELPYILLQMGKRFVHERRTSGFATFSCHEHEWILRLWWKSATFRSTSSCTLAPVSYMDIIKEVLVGSAAFPGDTRRRLDAGGRSCRRGPGMNSSALTIAAICDRIVHAPVASTGREVPTRGWRRQRRQSGAAAAAISGIPTPPRPSGTADSPSAGRSASQSFAQGPLTAFQPCGGIIALAPIPSSRLGYFSPDRRTPLRAWTPISAG